MQLPLAPLSNSDGYERGASIDQRYIEAFPAGHAAAIHGDGAGVKTTLTCAGSVQTGCAPQ